MRKADEMEKYHADRAAKYAFFFFSISLLVWTIYELIVHNKLGFQFIILLVGNVVFFATLKKKVDA